MELAEKRGKPERRLGPGFAPQNHEDWDPHIKPAEGAVFYFLQVLTVNDVVEDIGFGKFHWKMSFVSGFGWVGDAMELNILTILSMQLRCEWRLESYQVALMSSVVFLGRAISCPVWGVFCDKYGSRIGLVISTSGFLYFELLGTFAPTYGWFLFLRFLVGVGISGSPQSVILHSEFLPANMRVRCFSLLALFWTLGSMLEIVLALLVMPTLGWRWLLGLTSAPMGVFLIFNHVFPESPRFHILSGRTAKAVETLRDVAKQNGKPMPKGRIVAPKEDKPGRLRDLFTPQMRRTTLLLSFIWFSSVFCCFGIILLTPRLLQSVDSSGSVVKAAAGAVCGLQCKYLTSDDYKAMLQASIADVVGATMLLFLQDRLGRKKSMALWFFLFSLFTLPMFLCVGSRSITGLIFIARAVSIASMHGCFIYTPEVFPLQTRAVGIGLCTGFSNLGSLICPFVTEMMSVQSFHSALLLFCGCSLLAAFASLMLPTETHGGHQPKPR